jgi:diguanylate cyclase (GGDEF)-like protein/PAS domain S-box-containing protein
VRSDLSTFWDDLASCGGDTPRLLDVVARRVAEVLGDACVLTVLADDGQTLEPRAIFHADPEVRDYIRELLGSETYRVGHGVAGTVAADRRPFVIGEVDPALLAPALEPRSREFLDRHQIRSLMVVPMVGYGDLLGTLGAVRMASEAPYDDEDLMVLEALAERAALALADARRQPRTLTAADYEAIFRHSIDGVLLTVPDGRVLAANPAACDILQLSEVEICRMGRGGLVVGDDPRAKAAVAQRSISGRTRAEIPMRRGNGSVFVADVSSTVFTSAEGELRSCVIFRDVTEQTSLRQQLEAKTRQLQQLAEEDQLTRMRKRRGFDLAAEHALAFADREGVPLVVAYLDMDNLKTINDTFGHRIGDAAINRLAASISSVTRAVDVSARVGGDEFILLLYDARKADADVIIERIAAEVDGAGADVPPVKFSVGIAEREPNTEASLDDLIQAADRRMYENKTLRRVRKTRSPDRR